MKPKFVLTKNVKGFINLIHNLKNKPDNISKIGLIYGNAGLGKTKTALYLSIQYEALYVRATNSMSPKWMLEEIAKELDEIPRFYEDFSAFKLFVLDVGLLGAMTGLDAETIIDGNRIFEEFKGAIAEQYVLQQFKTIKDLPVMYWSNETSRAEVDFVIQLKSNVVPVEVKAEKNLQAKSLKVYMEKFKPNYAIRTSMADYKKTENLIDLPLYCIDECTQGDVL